MHGGRLAKMSELQRARNFSIEYRVHPVIFTRFHTKAAILMHGRLPDEETNIYFRLLIPLTLIFIVQLRRRRGQNRRLARRAVQGDIAVLLGRQGAGQR